MQHSFNKCLAGVLLSVASLAITAPAIGQFSKVKSAMERVRSLKGDISVDKDRASLTTTASALVDQAEVIRSSVKGLGKELAEARGPYSSERSNIRKYSDGMEREGERLWKQATNWAATLKSQADHTDMTRESLSETEIMIQSWETYVREIETRRRWINDGLAQAKELRENTAKPATELERAEEEYMAKEKEATERVKRAFLELADEEGRLADARVKEKQAFDAWRAAVGTEKGNEFSEKMKRLTATWADAQEKTIDSTKRQWDKFLVFQDLVGEKKRTIEYYIKSVTNLRRFIKDMSETGANQAWEDFTTWKEVLEKDFGR